MNKKKKLKIWFFVFIIIHSTFIFSTNIIFDLDGVLVNQNLKNAFVARFEYLKAKFKYKYLSYNCEGYWYFMNLILQRKCPHILSWFEKGCPDREGTRCTDIPNRLYLFLDDILFFLEDAKFIGVDGTKYPLTEDDKQILERLTNYMYQTCNVGHKDALFVKAELIQVTSILIDILKNKNEHKFYILSNTPPGILKELEKKFPQFFSCFSGALVSGDVGVLKPDQNIYKKFLKQFNLNPQDCVFIDDEIINVKVAAEKMKMTGILFDQRDIGAFLEELKRIKLIDQKNLEEIVEKISSIDLNLCEEVKALSLKAEMESNNAQ